MNYSSDKVSITTGCVKWFDPAKGFGFIVSEIGGPDILLHANVLRAFGQTSIAEGARVRVEVQTTPRGVQAVSIQEIEPPAPDRNVSATILSEIEELEREARLEPAGSSGTTGRRGSALPMSSLRPATSSCMPRSCAGQG